MKHGNGLRVSEIALLLFQCVCRSSKRVNQGKHEQKQLMIWGLVIIWVQSILQGFIKCGTNMHDKIGASVIRDFLRRR